MKEASDSKLSIGLVQGACRGDFGANLDNAERLVGEAVESGARIVCLQELFAAGYFCQREDPDRFRRAEPLDGVTCRRMAEVANRLGVVLVVPFFEKRAEGVYHNSAAVIDSDGTVLGAYRKMHIPDDPGFYEKYYFAPGDRGFMAWDTSVGRVGVCICWDQWFPEAARLTAMRGADILIFPTAIGWLPGEESPQEHEAWEICQRAHGITNGCFVAAANRVGLERDGDSGIHFWGQSFVSAPDGRIVGKLSAEEEGVLVVELDRTEIAERRNLWPLFRDRRPEAYSEITQRYIDA